MGDRPPFVNQRFVVVAPDAIDLNEDGQDEGVVLEVNYQGAATLMLELASSLMDDDSLANVRDWCERKCPNAVAAVFPADSGGDGAPA